MKAINLVVYIRLAYVRLTFNPFMRFFRHKIKTEAHRSEEASLKYRIEEMQSRVSYAASHEQQIRDKLVELRKDSDDLLKQRKKFRNDM